MPAVTGKGPPGVTILVTVVTLGSSCRCRVSTCQQSQGCLCRVSKVPKVTRGCPADNNPCSTLPTCEHIPALDQEFTFDKAEAVYTMPGAMALLRRYRKLAQPQRENRQHHRDHRGGGENRQHHNTTKNHRDHRGERW